MSDVEYLGLTANQLAKIASDLESENASLRGAAQGLGELCDRYKAENAKLRELCARLYRDVDKDAPMLGEYMHEMCELEVEVSE